MGGVWVPCVWRKLRNLGNWGLSGFATFGFKIAACSESDWDISTTGGRMDLSRLGWPGAGGVVFICYMNSINRYIQTERVTVSRCSLVSGGQS